MIRHGCVDAPSATYGNRDVGLSDEGRAQTEAVAAGFVGVDIAHVATSPLERAHAMGVAVAAVAGTSARVDGRLAELFRGDWQDLPLERYRQQWAAESETYWSDTLNWRAHGGESELQLFDRAWPALVEATHAATGGTAVVTAHRQVIRALVAGAIGLPPAASHGLRLDPAHGVLLVDAAGGWALARTNVARPGAGHAAEPSDGPALDVPMRPTRGSD